MTLSIVTWYGVITCALALISSLRRVDAALVQPVELGEQDRRVDDDTVADDAGYAPGVRIPEGRR